MAGEAAPAVVKPLLRGVLHQAAFVASLAAGPLLILEADGTRARFAAAVFAGSVGACFRASALYHRGTWTPNVRLLVRPTDQARAVLPLAGPDTPGSLLCLRG